MTPENWSIEQIDALFRLRRDGCTFTHIGLQIGKSRNACIGKWGRLRVAMGAHSVTPRKLLAPGDPRKKRNRKRDRPTPPPHSIEAEGFILKPLPVPRPVNVVGILEVTGCRWATGHDEAIPGGHTFCNEALAPAGHYCLQHASAAVSAYTPQVGRHFTKIPVSLIRSGAA